MRTFGIAFLAIGLVGLIFSMTMDTTVIAGAGVGRVHNIGLMNEKQNFLLVFGCLAVVGAVLLLRGSRSAAPTSQAAGGDRQCPQCAEYIKIEAKVCRFCGHNFGGFVPASIQVLPAAGEALPAQGYQVDGIGEGKWRVAHRARRFLAYPNTTQELEALATQEVGFGKHAE